MNQISTDFLQRPKVADPLAILVDGENMSLAFAKTLLKEAEAFGVPTVRRVYGKAEHIAGWENEGFRLVPTRPGKNSADLLLCVEAMSLALRESFQTLLIASSDRDFSYLAEHLRELGHQVVGIGEVKAPLAFRKTCSAFVEVQLSPFATSARTSPKALQPSLAEKVVNLLQTEGDRDGYLIAKLGGRMHALHKVKISETPEGNWRAYLLAHSSIFACDKKGAEARVRVISPAPHTVP